MGALGAQKRGLGALLLKAEKMDQNGEVHVFRGALFVRIITAAMIRKCIMHVGIIVFGLVLLGVNARKKRSLGAMMKKSDR